MENSRRTVRAVNDYEVAQFTSRLKSPNYAESVRGELSQRGLFLELADIILEDLGEIEWVEVPGTRRPLQSSPNMRFGLSGPSPLIPAIDGQCHFLKMPAELIRAIFSASLPSRSQVVQPMCGSRVESPETREFGPNRVADLMTLNKRLRDEVAEVVYEERTFSIHVHQGQRNAGIEFLHVGRQPLQYQASVTDGRFTKFRPGEIFGFSRLKKLEIVIFPSSDKCRHTAINAYYMILALVNLLGQGDDGRNRIASLSIIFASGNHHAHLHHHYQSGRAAIMAEENPWWDTENDRPRETSFHGIPDVQLVLRPFAQLWGVHSVDVILPPKLASHRPTVDFTLGLKRCMQGLSRNTTFNNTSLNAQLEATRAAHEEYMFRSLYGSAAGAEHDKLKDLDDDDDDDDDEDDGHDNHDDDDDEDDDGDAGPDADLLRRVDVEHKKHKLSPYNTEAEDGRKRVHVSNNTPRSGRMSLGESSHMDIDPSGDSLFAATKSAINMIARFVEICGTTEDEARYWLGKSYWDLENAASGYMDALDSTRAAEDPMVIEGPSAPVKRQYGRADRDIDDDDDTTPTRPGRAGGPLARTRGQQKRLRESHFSEDNEDQYREGKGKGKGRAKRVDFDESDGPIARWNDPSNFQSQGYDHCTSDPHNIGLGMLTDGHGSYLAAAPNPPMAAGRPRTRSPTIPSSKEWAVRLTSLYHEHGSTGAELQMPLDGTPWGSTQIDASSDEDSDVFDSHQDESDSRRRILQRFSNAHASQYGHMNGPQSRNRSIATQPMRSDSAAESTTGPRPMPLRRSTSNMLPPQVQAGLSNNSSINSPALLHNAILEEYQRLIAAQILDPNATEPLQLPLDPDDPIWQSMGSGHDPEHERTPSPPRIPANTAEDFPEWAGTSYWSDPTLAVAPAPEAEATASSASTTTVADSAPLPVIHPAIATRYRSDNTFRLTTRDSEPSARRSPLPTHSEASQTYIGATAATSTTAPTAASATASSQLRANRRRQVENALLAHDSSEDEESEEEYEFVR